MIDRPVRILNIIGCGRSGSTMLHNILGQIDGFFAVGELRDVWERGLLWDWKCGCGVRFGECDVWHRVLDHAFGGRDKLDAEEMARFTESFRIRDLPLTWIPLLRRRKFRQLEPYMERIRAIYASIHDVTGCRVIVDSSKNPSYGHLLEQIPGIEVAYIHFIRDAPAVAYSWTKRKLFEAGKAMPRRKVSKSALQWNARNLSAELFLPKSADRRIEIRYEDFMLDPQSAVANILKWYGESTASLPFTSSHEVTLERANHSVFGNAVRFQTGSVSLRTDDQWRKKLSRRDALVVNALTFPLRARYGYLSRKNFESKTKTKSLQVAQ